MQLKKQTTDKLVIDNNHEYFKETEYKDINFSVTIQYDNTTYFSILVDAMKDYAIRTGSQSTDVPDGIVYKWRLLTHIISWSGFKNTQSEEIPCNFENKSAFYEEKQFATFFAIVRRIANEYESEIKTDEKVVEDAAKKR